MNGYTEFFNCFVSFKEQGIKLLEKLKKKMGTIQRWHFHKHSKL